VNVATWTIIGLAVIGAVVVLRAIVHAL